jgi:hypothetical protein
MIAFVFGAGASLHAGYPLATAEKMKDEQCTAHCQRID